MRDAAVRTSTYCGSDLRGNSLEVLVRSAAEHIDTGTLQCGRLLPQRLDDYDDIRIIEVDHGLHARDDGALEHKSTEKLLLVIPREPTLETSPLHADIKPFANDLRHPLRDDISSLAFELLGRAETEVIGDGDDARYGAREGRIPRKCAPQVIEKCCNVLDLYHEHIAIAAAARRTNAMIVHARVWPAAGRTLQTPILE